MHILLELRVHKDASEALVSVEDHQAIRENIDVAQELQALYPAADAIGNLWLRAASELKVVNLRLNLEKVG